MCAFALWSGEIPCSSGMASVGEVATASSGVSGEGTEKFVGEAGRPPTMAVSEEEEDSEFVVREEVLH